MEKGTYKFSAELAGLKIDIETRYGYTKKLFSDYICDDVRSCDICITYDDTELEKECEKEPSYPEFYHESLLVYRKICTEIIKYNAMLIHSSAISLDGEAYLFTAPSGTGKSTHTRLWREYFSERAVMVNDDKPIIREHNGRFFVYGTPYMGQHKLGANMSVPIKAICIVARGENNDIERLGVHECISTLLNQTLMPSNEQLMDKLLSTVDNLLKSVPVYRLKCNISDEAVRVAYEGMKGNLL